MAKRLLDEALDGWRFAREGVVAELDNIPADRMDFRPTDASRTVAELVQHIIESGRMMAGELSRPDGDFTRQSYPDFLSEYAPDVGSVRAKADLVAALNDSFIDGTERLRRAGERLMLEPITQFNGEPARRLSWMSHGVAHEEYHRGQLALYARLMGLVPALTQLIEQS
jgi:uncharacterized damage-inducible protein DinB